MIITFPKTTALLLLLSSTTITQAQEINHASGYHWARSTDSFNLQVINSVASSAVNNWADEFDIAIRDWSDSTKLNIVGVCGDKDANTRSTCPQVDGKVRVCNFDYGDTGWYGIAQWSYNSRTKHFSSAVVKLNDKWSYNDVGRKHLMCHEIGHTLGLGHTSVNGSSQSTCMDYALEAYASRNPNNNDYVVLEGIYGHRDNGDSYEKGVPPCIVSDPGGAWNSINEESPPTEPTLDLFVNCDDLSNQECQDHEVCYWNTVRDACRVKWKYANRYEETGICDTLETKGQCVEYNGCRWARKLKKCRTRSRGRDGEFIIDDLDDERRNLRGGAFTIELENEDEVEDESPVNPEMENGDPEVESDERRPIGRQYGRTTAEDFGLPPEARIVSRSAVVATFEITEGDVVTKFDVWLAEDRPEGP